MAEDLGKAREDLSEWIEANRKRGTVARQGLLGEPGAPSRAQLLASQYRLATALMAVIEHLEKSEPATK